MTGYWEPGTAYGQGDVVEYQGHRYKIVIPHTSQSDWAPTVTPNLWGRLDDHDQGGQEQHHGHHGGQQGQGYQQQQPANYQPPPQAYPSPPQDQKVDIHHEERKKKWWDLDDDRKKQLEIGGGLLAGLAAAAGGYALYKHHEKSEDEKKADAWALQNWMHEAEARLNDYRQYGLRGPAQWILNRGTNIPNNAILVGPEKEWNLYICRAYCDGGIQVGKASDAFKKGAVIGYKNEEVHLDTYEILVGDMRGLHWVDASGRLNVNSLGARPVEGGHENDGTPLYVACAPHKDAVHPGKASEKLDGAYIPYDDKEKCIKNYRVLCYN
ncbi:carbohydrate-binding module family 12 protein [Dendrothele bispora CBS 962.96]|uniref:Carbohydrate-binding module family 12 protein n=1 Tax=Dendrothele bispora (strain CBS 962.96) TaxID=1314807 RepID=A0A4S8MUA5_DENBC|nr:carbohydrate-binding module family 12 protein [Dendrothele bispora CBS 962.96]